MSLKSVDSSAETINTLFEDAVKRWPQNVALDFESTSCLTYLDLSLDVSSLSASLVDIVTRGQLVPVLLPRSFEQISIILAIVKLGAVYVPIDPDTPPARLYTVLWKLQPSVIITADDLVNTLVELGFNKQNCITPKSHLHQTEHTLEGKLQLEIPPAQPDDLAAVLFTSGSTGEPKGVRLSHRNLIAPVCLLSELEDIDVSSSVFQFAACSFDVHIIDIFCSLFNGSRLCLVSNVNMLSNLGNWVAHMQASIIHLTPSVISTLDPAEVLSLKCMVACGEPVTQSVVNIWSQRLLLINLYGPCEASSIVAKVLTPESDPAVIGYPTKYATIRLLDHTGIPVADGEVGEIHCSGDSVALGYLEDSENVVQDFKLTNAASSADTYQYATGDFACYTSAGEIKLCGRQDRQVKISGQRVELSEIDRAIQTIAASCTTFVKKDNSGQLRLFSFAVKSFRLCSNKESCLIQLDESDFVRDLIRVCRSLLPRYMVPRILVLPCLPVNSSGKIDKKRMEGILDSEIASTMADKPSAEIHNRYLNSKHYVSLLVASQLHQLQCPPVKEDLRLWGLTSLDAMLLVKDLYTAFGVSFTLAEIFQKPTIDQLAQALDHKLNIRSPTQSRLASPQKFPLAALDSDESSLQVKTSPGQDRIFIAQKLDPSHAYNCNFVLDVAPFQLDSSRFCVALKVIVQRHQVLRSTYHESDNSSQLQGDAFRLCYQQVHSVETLSPVLSVINHAALLDSASHDARHAALQMMEQNSKKIFDLSKDSPVCVWLYEIGVRGDAWLIHFNIHHIAVDEWSFDILCYELEALYEALGAKVIGLPKTVSGVIPQYSDFAAWSRQQRKDSYSQENLRWWTEQVDDEHIESLIVDLVPQPLLPVLTRGHNESEVHVHPLNSSAVRRFNANQCQESTPFVGWLSLCQIVLAKASSKTKFLLGVPVSERGKHPGFYNTIGFFLNTLVIPVTVDLGNTYQSFLVSVDRQYHGCMVHSMPYEDIMKCLKHKFGSRSDPKVKTLFVFHDTRGYNGDLADRPTNFLRDSRKISPYSIGAQFDLVIHFDDCDGEPQLRFDFRRNSMSKLFIASIGSSFETLLEDVLRSSSTLSLSCLQYLSAVDRERIEEWAVTPPLSALMKETWIAGKGTLLHELFEKAVTRNSDAIAISSAGGESITYFELQRRANQFAHILAYYGASSSKIGAVFLDKSPSLIISQLAILMTGAAFVMLDPIQKAALNKSKIRTICPDLIVVDSSSSLILRDLQFNTNMTVVDVSAHNVLHETSKLTAPIDISSSAYYCFTSGSTGNPKCFSVPHSAAAASIMSHVEVFDMKCSNKIGMVSTTTFDVSILETFVTLASGGTLCVAPSDAFMTSLAEVINSLHISHLFLTPTMLSTLADPLQTPSLRFVALLGEPIPFQIFIVWVNSVDLHNLYGPAEMAFNTHTRSFKPYDKYHEVGQSIGKPLPSVRSFILDNGSNLTLPGCKGYLCFGGHLDGHLSHLGGEYVSPRSANSRYIQHPVFGRIYNSGDLAVYDPHGNATLLGRSDNQVKLHGIRFDINDMERTFETFCDKKCSVFISLCDSIHWGEKVVVLFIHVQASIEAADKQDGDSSWLSFLSLEVHAILYSLQEKAHSGLDDAIIPTYWIPIRYVPRNHNGKVDRTLLGHWFCELEQMGESKARSFINLQLSKAEVSTKDFDFTTSRLGQKLLHHWESILRLPKGESIIGRSFFHLGGDSISAIRLASRLRSEGILGFTVSQLYKYPTFDMLYEVLAPLQGSSELQLPVVSQQGSIYDLVQDHSDVDAIMQQIDLSEIKIPQPQVNLIYPVSNMQYNMLLQSAANPELYSTQAILKFMGTFDLLKIQEAWKTVRATHPSLTTTFISITQENTVQFFMVEQKVTRDLFGLQTVLAPFDSSAFENELNDDRKKGFKAGGPMIRVKVYRRTESLHYVVITCHHAISDGWSLAIILKNLSTAYQDQPIPAGISFSQVVAFNRGSDKQAAKAYWRKILHGYEPSYLQPRVKKGIDENVLISRQMVIHALAAQKLGDIAKGHDFSPATIFQAALAFLLSRMTGGEDIVIGVMVSGRDIDIGGVEQAVGNFLNTIPLRCSITGESSTAEWLRRIHATFVEGVEHHHLSLIEILQQSKTSSNMIQSVLVFENQEAPGRLEFGEKLMLDSVEGREFSEVPFTVVVQYVDEGTQITFKCDQTLYQSNQLDILLEFYISVVTDLIAATLTDGLVSSLGQAQSYYELDTIVQAVKELKGLLCAEPPKQTLVSMFDDAVCNYGTKVALQTPTAGMTYIELSEKSNHIATALRSLGVGCGDIVPILFDKSFDMIAIMLGIMRAGAAYCPIDTQSPQLRLISLLEEVGSKISVCHPLYVHRLSTLQKPNLQVFTLEDLVEKGSRLKGYTDQSSVLPNSVCYVLFTSGSTGQPKGCVLTHAAVANCIQEASRIYRLTPDVRALLYANYVFDASVIDIYGCLSAGATLYLPSQDELLLDLNSIISSYGINFIHVTPSVARLLSPETSLCLKTLVLGGERVPQSLHDVWADKVCLIDGYGLTECAVQVSATILTPRSELSVIKTLFSKCLVVLLDNQMNVPRIGQVGEIYVGGRQLLAGYWGKHKILSTTFVTPRFDSDVKLFPTGDIGMYNTNMQIQIIGRHDAQIKLTGQRIEPEEVEAVLNSAPNILRSVTLVHGQRLHALVQLLDDKYPTTSETLREWCIHRLPAQLVPLVSLTASIPMTASNKIDRHQVQTDFDRDLKLAKPSLIQRAQSPKELFIAAAISKIVGQNVTDIHLPFVYLGLNSLGLMQLRANLAKHYKLNLKYAQLNNAGNIESLSRLLGILPSGSVSGQAVPNPQPNKIDSLQASNSQRTMWTAQLHFQDSTYNVGRVLELLDIDFMRLHNALQHLIENVDLFKLTFDWMDSTASLCQRLHRESRVRLSVEDLRESSDLHTIVKSICQNDFESVFDLVSGPLVSFILIRCTERSCFLYLNIHHILVDEWTCDMLFNMLFSWYSAKNSQYDIMVTATLMSSNQDPSEHEVALCNWKEQLKDLLPLHLPNWQNRNAALKKRTAATLEKNILSPNTLSALTTHFKSHGLTEFSTFFSLFFLLVHRYTSMSDLAILTPISTRGMNPETLNVLGNMTSTSIIRSKLTSEDTLLSLTHKTAKAIEFAMDNAFVPLEKVLASINSSVTEHSVLFTYNDEPRYGNSLQFQDCSSEMIAKKTAMFDISLNISLRSGHAFAHIEYDAAKFEAEYMKRLLESFCFIVNLASQMQPTVPLRYLSTYNSIEADCILRFSNANMQVNDNNTTLLHERFEHQARTSPKNIAIDFWSKGYHRLTTYQELDLQSTQIAYVLQEQYKIGLGQCVPVYLDQSPGLLAAVLAVLKTGATYTPLPRDGSWPIQEIRAVLQTCNANVIITDISVIPGIDITTINIKDLPELTGELSVQCQAHGTSIAYVIWTSGTTGVPKGVQITHSSAATAISSMVKYMYQRTSDDRVFQFASTTFDASIEDYFSTLSTGATLCVVPRQELLENIGLALAALRPTSATLTSSVASLLTPEEVPLKTLVVAGEMFSEKVKKIWGGCMTRLINAYGPAENAMLSTFGLVTKDKDVRCIGKPFPTVRALILDPWLSPTPLFVEGEIFLGGSHIFKGYVSRTKSLDSVLIDHEQFGRLYRTGDMGYFDQVGQIVFCGRRDRQTKFRGHRIELSSLSEIIELFPDVDRATVLVIREKLVAFIVWARLDKHITKNFTMKRIDGPAALNLRSLLAFLSTKIVASTTPTIWLELSDMPVTSSGKTNFRRLEREAEAEAEAFHLIGDQVDPETALERIVHDCCCEVLGYTSLSMNANIFELGLDSFSAIALVSKLRKAIPWFTWTLSGLVSTQTLRTLVPTNPPSLFGLRRIEINMPAVSTFSTATCKKSYPASSIQERFYSSQELHKDSTYSSPIVFELKTMDIGDVERVVRKIIKRNAIFRTTFTYDHKVQQLVLPYSDPRFTVHNLVDQDYGSNEAKMKNIVRDDLDIAFDSNVGPLIRCHGFRLKGGRQFFYVNIHHLITDEQSLRLFTNEIVTENLAESLTSNPESQSRLQYVDYCLEEQRCLAEPAFSKAALEFWTGYLRDVVPIWKSTLRLQNIASTELQTVKHQVKLQGNAFEWIQKKGVTPFSIFLGLFQVLLFRLWAAQRPTVVIPISQRPDDCHSMYGCFINTVPICALLTGSTSLEDTLTNATKNLFSVIQNSHLPYKSMLRCAGIPPDHIQVMFTYHNASHDISSGKLMKAEYILPTKTTNVGAKFPLNFSITERQSGDTTTFDIVLDYEKHQAYHSEIIGLCGRYATLLLSASKGQGSTPISRLEILSGSDYTFFDKNCGSLETKNIPDLLAHEAVEAQCVRTPNHVACWFEGREKLTYSELWSKVRGLSEQLSYYHRCENNHVCLFLDAGFERIFAIVALLYCGFAYIPLDIHGPPARNVRIIQDCNPQFILVSKDCRGEYNTALQALKREISKTGHLAEFYVIDNVRRNQLFSFDRIHDVDQKSLAYILYTSGSTSRPKGVQIEHRALRNSLQAHRLLYKLEPSSNLLQFAPWTFDVSVVDILGSLSSGATLCLGRKDYLLSNLSSAINTMSISHLATTPTVIRLITPAEVSTIKVLAIGGEPMTELVRDTWGSAAILLNMYGPTETTVNVLSCRVGSQSDVNIIGRPLSNCRAYILDGLLGQVPPGSAGQLAIGGVQLARGYLNRPEENKAFVDHEQFGRIYLTGDQVKYTLDGSISFLGRFDNQVKLRGQRIELSEIESLVTAEPGVKQAAAFLCSIGPTESLAVGFCRNGRQLINNGKPQTLSSESSIAMMNNMYARLSTDLPAYLIPKYWIPLEFIPSTLNGKTDRHALSTFLAALPTEERMKFVYDRSAPVLRLSLQLSTAKEKLVGLCIEEVLGTSMVFKDSNFFSLSGDSISAIRLCTLLRGCNLVVTVKQIYLWPTVAQLASAAVYTTKLPSKEATHPYGMIQPTPIMNWFLSLCKHNPHWYNQSYTLKLSKVQDLEKMTQAWENIVAIHPMLRLRCHSSESGLKVVVPEVSGGNDFRVIRHNALTQQEFFDVSVQVQSGLHLEHGPISALGLITLSGDAHCVIAVHHLAIDIVSWQIILDDLEILLQGQERLIPEQSSFYGWSKYVLKLDQNENSSCQKYQDVSVSQIRHPNTKIASNLKQKSQGNTISSSRSLTVNLESSLTSYLLTEANSAYRTEAVDLLLSAMVLAFRDWRGIDELEICFESHGRDFQNEFLDLSRTVGWFTYIFDMMLKCPFDLPLDQLIAHVKDTRSRCTRNPDFSKPIPIMENHPAIFFNYSGSYSTSKRNSCFQVVQPVADRCDEDPRNRRSVVLDIECGVLDGVLEMSVIYSTAFYEEHDIFNLIKFWQSSLDNISRFCRLNSRKFQLTSSDLPFLVLEYVDLTRLVKTSLLPYSLEPYMVEDITEATDMQSAMIVASQESGSYIESFTFEIQGEVNIPKFRKAWSDVVVCHSALRTVFVPCELRGKGLDDQILQVIIKANKIEIPTVLETSSKIGLTFEYGRSLFRVYLHSIKNHGFQFTLQYHHAIADGWSHGIMLRDFERAYLGTHIESISQFKQAASIINAYSRSPKSGLFWRSQLLKVVATHLVDYTNVPVNVDVGLANSRFKWNLQCPVKKLEDFAASKSLTPSVILRAAWAMTLSYYTEQDDVIFGVTTSGRSINLAGIEETVGPCINTVPFRIQIEWNGSKIDFLTKVQANDTAIIEHEAMSLHRIYRESSTRNLFNTVIVYQNQPKFEADTALPFKMILTEIDEATEIPLDVMIGQDNNASLHATVLLHGQEFSMPFLQNILTSFGLAIHGLCITERPTEECLRDITMLSRSHEDKIDSLIPGTGKSLAESMSVWQMFEERALSVPQNHAIEFYESNQTRTLTYQQALTRARQGADVLRTKGVQVGDRIALYLDKSPEMVLTILSILQVGGVYIPIEREIPHDRLRLLLKESKPKSIIISCLERTTWWKDLYMIIYMEDLFSQQPSSDLMMPSSRSTVKYDPDRLAAIIFTSGTTGVPKGVCMPQRQLVGYAITMAHAYRYNTCSRVFCFSRYVFDVAISDILGGFYSGATICLASQQDIINNLSNLLYQTRATTVNLTSSVASLLDPEEVPYLQSIILTGEALTPALIQLWSSRIHVVNSYGPTEAAVITWTDTMPDSDPRCVGQAVPGMEIMILDARHRKTPIGSKGTIFTSGKQLSLGYLNRPELTSQYFINNPYRTDTLMYNTGDLGAYNSDGKLLHLGRKDNQVKIHGQRVELGAIASVMSQNGPSVTISLISLSDHDIRLVAFFPVGTPSEPHFQEPEVVLNSRARKLSRKLLARAIRSLPSYMVPMANVPLNHVPLTMNGKADQAALRKCYLEDFLPLQSEKRIGQVVEPINQLERAIHSVVSDTFNLSHLSVETDLFASILDSLSCIRLVGNLRKKLKLPINIQYIMENRTVRNLALKLSESGLDQESTTNQDEMTSRTDIGMMIHYSKLRKHHAPTLFCIHPSSGLSFEFRNVVEYLTEMNVVGINNPKFGRLDNFQSVEDIALEYHNAITKMQPTGPYFILGYSFGAHIVVEVARLLLHSAPSCLPKLILVDSSALPLPQGYLTLSTVATVVNRIGLKTMLPASYHEEDFVQSLQREVEHNLRLMVQYTHTFYPGPAILLKAYDSPDASSGYEGDRSNGYTSLVDSLTTYNVYGDHYEIFKPGKYLDHNGRVLAKALGFPEGISSYT